MTRLGTRSLLASAVACAAVFAVSAGGSAAGKGKHALPNLVVTEVSSPPAGLVEGRRFVVEDRTRNKGRGKAGRSTTRYYLTKDPAQSQRNREHSKTNPRTSETDILLVGARDVKALRPGRSSRGSTTVEVPAGTPAGRYTLLACADDRGAVKEKKEQDNCKASAAAQTVRPLGGSSGRIDAFSDTFPPLAPDDESGVRQALRIACIAPTPPRKMSLAQAVASAKVFLTRVAGPDAMSSFAASGEYRNVSVLAQAAAAAILSKSPGAALAAELRAHELQPKEATHLENAAGVAASIGLPNEAIAFLDAAARLDERKRLPMGVARQAAALSTRGYALLQLGKMADAERTLQEALSLSPILNEEASMTLAAAQACRGKNPIPAFRRGMRRQDPPKPPKLPMDESQAKATELRPFPFPATPEAALGDKDFFEKLVTSETARYEAWAKRQADLGIQLNQVEQTLPDLSAERIREIDYIRTDLFEDADLKGLFAQYDKQWNIQLNSLRKWGTAEVKWNQQALDACVGATDPDACYTREMRSRCIPGTKPIFQEWRTAAVNEYNVAKTYQHIWSLRVSALASNLSNQVAYKYMLGWVESPGEIGNEIGTLAGFADAWARALDSKDSNGTYFCVQSPEPEAPSDPGAITQQGSGPCPPALKGLKAVFDLGFAKLKGNCEEIKLSASTKGWISAFGEVKYTFKSGSLTLFGGSKGEVGLGPVKGDFKSGIYVKTDMSGIKEVGWRVGPTFTAGAGPAEFSKSDYVDIKIIGSYGNPVH